MSTYSSRRFRPFCCFTQLLILVLLYVLSFGPVQALFTSQRLQGAMPKEVATFYKPVKWLHEQTALSKPMATYEGWWKQVLKRS